MSKNQLSRTFERTKKLNLDRWTAFAKATAVKRDKIEPICSPKMYVERTPKCRSPASRGTITLAGSECTSTLIFEILVQGIFASHRPRPVRLIADRDDCVKLVSVL
jgi:hypothetical protein